MNRQRVWALFKRELKDIFRDKKTLFMMVVIPLLLYPLIMVAMTLIMSAIMSDQMETTYKVAFVDVAEEDQDAIEEIFADEKEFSYHCKTVNSKNPQKDLQKEDIDCYVSVKDLDGQKQFTIQYLSAVDDSATAKEAMQEALELYRDNLRIAIVEENGLDKNSVLFPIQYESDDLSTTEESVGNMLGSIIPLIIITSILLGAVYPAIDVTAGEKERGTLETLLTLPVTNFEMIMSKFLAVSVIACISAVLNIMSMGAATVFMVNFAMEGAASEPISYGTFLPAIGFTLVVMIFFAMFVTAVCMSVCVFAKSFKEANNYITPVMLVFMFCGYVAMVPDIELNTMTAAIPVINITLMIEMLFGLSYNYALFGIVLISNVVYSVLAVWVLGRIYRSEEVLFAEGLSSVKIFTRRSEMKKGQMPGVGDVLLLCCVSMIGIFYVGTFAALKLGVYGTVVQQGILLLLPVLYAVYLKCDMKKLFSIRRPGIWGVGGTLLIGMGGFLLLQVVAVLLTGIFGESAEAVETAFGSFGEVPFPILFLMLAVMPAIGEELLFRGFIFGTLKNRCRPVSAMVIVSCIFGIYHMSLIKFFTTALLGMIIVFVVWKTKSIFSGMLLHFINNGLAVISMRYPEVLDQMLPKFVRTATQSQGTLIVLIAGSLLVIPGVLLLKGMKENN